MKRLMILLFILLIACTRVDLTKHLKTECDSINNTGEKDVCYNNKAIREKNPGVCTKIQDLEYKKWCLGIVYERPISTEFKPSSSS